MFFDRFEYSVVEPRLLADNHELVDYPFLSLQLGESLQQPGKILPGLKVSHIKDTKGVSIW